MIVTYRRIFCDRPADTHAHGNQCGSQVGSVTLAIAHPGPGWRTDRGVDNSTCSPPRRPPPVTTPPESRLPRPESIHRAPGRHTVMVCATTAARPARTGCSGSGFRLETKKQHCVGRVVGLGSTPRKQPSTRARGKSNLQMHARLFRARAAAKCGRRLSLPVVILRTHGACSAEFAGAFPLPRRRGEGLDGCARVLVHMRRHGLTRARAAMRGPW